MQIYCMYPVSTALIGAPFNGPHSLICDSECSYFANRIIKISNYTIRALKIIVGFMACIICVRPV